MKIQLKSDEDLTIVTKGGGNVIVPNNTNTSTDKTLATVDQIGPGGGDKANSASLAAPYESDHSSAYVVGDYVTHEGTLYKCKTDTSDPPGEWDDNNWVPVAVTDEMGGSQEQADWNQSDSTAPDFIKNKPTIPSAKPTHIYNAAGTDALDDKGQLFVSTVGGNYWTGNNSVVFEYQNYSDRGWGGIGSTYNWKQTNSNIWLCYKSETGIAYKQNFSSGTWHTENRGSAGVGLDPTAGDVLADLPDFFATNNGLVFHKKEVILSSSPYAHFALESLPGRTWAAGTWNVGDLVKYNSKAYRCIAAATSSNTSAPSSDTTHWAEIALLSDKAPLASPAFTGTPTAPTAAAGTNTTQIANTAFVQTAIGNKANADSLADIYDKDHTSAYIVGDYVTYEGTLYKCKTKTPNPPGEWSGDANWTATNINNEFVKLTGDQTIAGTKTFTGNCEFNAIMRTAGINSLGNILANGISVKGGNNLGFVGGGSIIMDGGGISITKDGFVLLQRIRGPQYPPNFIVLELDSEGTSVGQYNILLPIANGTVAIQSSIAPVFSDSETYAVGDYVVYEGLLYKCATAVETSGSWTGDTNWTEVTVTDEMGGGGPHASTHAATGSDPIAPDSIGALRKSPNISSSLDWDSSNNLILSGAYLQIGDTVYDDGSVYTGGQYQHTWQDATGIVAHLDDIPDVPIKAVKRNGTALTPDAQGAVNVVVPTTASEVGAMPESYTGENIALFEYGPTIATAVNTVNGGLRDIIASIAAAFSKSETYAAGDYCTYEGTLYKCVTAVSTPGAWTGDANWAKATVTDEMATVGYVDSKIGDINSILDAINGEEI